MGKPVWIAILGMAAVLGIAGCGTEPDKAGNKLDFTETGKATLTVGETSVRWKTSRTTVQSDGKTATEDYTYFTLESSDTTVAGVVNTQYVVAKKAGTASIIASDNRSNLKTETPVQITVVDAP